MPAPPHTSESARANTTRESVRVCREGEGGNGGRKGGTKGGNTHVKFVGAWREGEGGSGARETVQG